MECLINSNFPVLWLLAVCAKVWRVDSKVPADTICEGAMQKSKLADHDSGLKKTDNSRFCIQLAKTRAWCTAQNSTVRTDTNRDFAWPGVNWGRRIDCLVFLLLLLRTFVGNCIVWDSMPAIKVGMMIWIPQTFRGSQSDWRETDNWTFETHSETAELDRLFKQPRSDTQKSRFPAIQRAWSDVQLVI
jgi:hypothetical protein